MRGPSNNAADFEGRSEPSCLWDTDVNPSGPSLKTYPRNRGANQLRGWASHTKHPHEASLTSAIGGVGLCKFAVFC